MWLPDNDVTRDGEGMPFPLCHIIFACVVVLFLVSCFILQWNQGFLIPCNLLFQKDTLALTTCNVNQYKLPKNMIQIPEYFFPTIAIAMKFVISDTSGYPSITKEFKNWAAGHGH